MPASMRSCSFLLLLAAGLLTVSDAGDAGRLSLSGSRATEIAASLPLVRLPE